MVDAAHLGLPHVHHVGIVVRDCAEASARLSALTGSPAMAPFDDPYPHVLVEGKTQPFSLRLSFLRLGALLIELLEPLDKHSPHAAFLAARGEGLHHLGFQVEDLQGQAARLEGLGLHRIVDASIARGTSHWMYLGRDLTDGSVIELMAKTPQGQAFFHRVDEELQIVDWRTDGGSNP